MRGRKPALKLVPAAPVAGKCPSAPAWLPPHAKAEWRRTVPYLHARGLLAPEVMATVETYCAAVGAVRDLDQVMIREGRLVDGKPHAAFRMWTTAMREARLLATELGVTPHRRAAAGQNSTTAGDGWDPDLLA